jgi:hypothetical protein
MGRMVTWGFHPSTEKRTVHARIRCSHEDTGDPEGGELRELIVRCQFQGRTPWPLLVQGPTLPQCPGHQVWDLEGTFQRPHAQHRIAQG